MEQQSHVQFYTILPSGYHLKIMLKERRMMLGIS